MRAPDRTLKNKHMKVDIQRFIYALTLFGLIAAVTAGCMHRQPTPEELLQNFLRKTVHQLKLDAPQEEKLRLLGEALQAARETLESDIVPVMKSLFADIRSAHLDRSLISQLQKLGKLISSDMAPQIIKRLTEFYTSLSGEQRDRLGKWLKTETAS